MEPSGIDPQLFPRSRDTNWIPQHYFYEQSSQDIWEACCRSVRGALSSARTRYPSLTVSGMGFDATCSLYALATLLPPAQHSTHQHSTRMHTSRVVLGEDDKPVTVSLSGEADRNIIVWMDHRALGQADRINSTPEAKSALQYVGGVISPEMESPVR